MNCDRKIGVINWDCSLPSDTYFGGYLSSSLSPMKYRNRVPYYADILPDGTVTCHYRTLEEYEQEMQYAINAGIDYFAYCWYDSTGKQLPPICDGTAALVDDKVYELTYARKLHSQSRLRNKLKLCAILSIIHPYSEEAISDLIDEMQQEYYQDVNGRPLVYLYGNGYDIDFIRRLRTACKASGINPYIVFQWSSKDANIGDYSEADGIFYYSSVKRNITKYKDLATYMLAENEARKKYGIDIIPHFTVGWNPKPRIDNPVPWCTYPEADYVDTDEISGYMEAAEGLDNWIEANQQQVCTGHILTFAWNEFEEGAYICPTLNTEGKPDTAKLDEFAKVVAYWKRQK